jgi:hypothetical protein
MTDTGLISSPQGVLQLTVDNALFWALDRAIDKIRPQWCWGVYDTVDSGGWRAQGQAHEANQGDITHLRLENYLVKNQLRIV